MELLERDTELSALGERFDAVLAGAGCIALVSGEAGVGKSSLLREFVESRAGRARVLWGGCDALFTPRPLAPLHDMARHTAGALAAALAANSERETLFATALDELDRADSPTLAVFEDMQWADEATLDLVKFLGR